MLGRKIIAILLTSVGLSGCTSTNISNSLGTLKNPYPTLSPPWSMTAGDSNRQIHPFIEANYSILLEATQLHNNERVLRSADTDDMRRYLGAGFALSDIYCDHFFRDADESQRRRRFGRGLTNDIGTTITAILGLASAGENLVTGVATGFGLADNMWRNYDEAFVVAANLGHVRTLVLAAQDNFRELTLGRNATNPLPGDYGTAQSVILRYANFCSTLGMQDLLNRSADQQRDQFNRQTEAQRAAEPAPEGDAMSPQAPPVTPALTSNAPGPQQ